jgi:Protein of unknown function (DUF3455)
MKTYVAALILAAAVALPEVARAQRPEPPQVPETIQVPAGYKVFFAGHAIGTQGYVCVAVGSVYRWTLFGPQATLFNGQEEQTLTHFLSPTPYSQLPNPAWQHSRDSSIVWGQAIRSSSDPNFVAQGAIPWLLLEAAVVGTGPTDGDKLVVTRFIQRVNTVDGMAPSTGCASPQDVAKRALVPYEADYFFFKEKAFNDPRD